MSYYSSEKLMKSANRWPSSVLFMNSTEVDTSFTKFAKTILFLQNMLKSANGPPTSHQAATVPKSALQLPASTSFYTANKNLKSALPLPTSLHLSSNAEFPVKVGIASEVGNAIADFLIHLHSNFRTVSEKF